MEDAIIIIVLVVILSLAIGYIVRAKKKGAKCIGCPVDKCSGSCSCCAEQKSEDNSPKL